MKLPLAKLVYTLVTLAVIAYAFFALRGPQGIPALMEKQKQIQELEKSNVVLAREIEQKRAQINRLRENQSEQELQIRKRLKLVKPGEQVYLLEDPGNGDRN